MDITKRDSKMLKGVAILSMLMLHLFCRRENLPYTPLLWIGGTICNNPRLRSRSAGSISYTFSYLFG